MILLYERLGVQNPFDKEGAFVTSPILSPLVLAAVRFTFAFYTLFTLIFVLVWDAIRLHIADAYFSYFTELSYIGLCAYFFASGVQTLVYALSQGRSYPLQKWPRFLQFLHVLLFATITAFPIITTIIYWSALHPSSPFTERFDVWSNTSMHAFNTIFASFEILCTHGGPAPWVHTPFLILLLAGYLGVVYITHRTEGFYAISFLNPQKEGATLAGWIIGIGAATVVIFAITRMLCVAREWIACRFSCGMGNAHRVNLPVERIDEWETIDIEPPSSPRRTDGESSSETANEFEKVVRRKRENVV
ncbi:hypothetical protein DFH11DRAFT_645641 [Phellopilus nigrolimitatus]|nr:hypothetical protein DFH11DRAFT_645641 [Phellopilus nigrolimitatus]